MMNEAVLRSPKWMRNFVDFELNTGEDIKGEPSEKRKKELEKERQEKEEARRKREKKEREEREEQDKQEFQSTFNAIIGFIMGNYRQCKITIPRANFIIIEKDGLHIEGINLDFKITFNNNIQIPTFDVQITYGRKKWGYDVSGVSYWTFKNFILTDLYEWFKRTEQYKQQSKSSSSSGSRGHYDPNYGKSYDDDYEEYKYKRNYSQSSSSSKTETDPFRANKRRRFDLLKNTLNGYEREMDKIKDWERKNPGKKHVDRDAVQNQIANVKDKINIMNKEYKFESLYYLKHLSHITLS